MATKLYKKTDTWGPYEREGYSDSQKIVAYTATRPAERAQTSNWLRIEEWIALLGFVSAVAWSVFIVSGSYPNLDRLWQTPGPIEACAVAALIWLHAKWRRSVRPR